MRGSTVKRAELGPLSELGKGGRGTVFRIESPPFHFPGVSDIAYKEFKKPLSAEELVNIRALVTMYEGLDDGERAVIDNTTTWPLRLVLDAGTVVGYLMRVVPQDFFSTQTMPSGKTKRVITDAQWLVVDPADDALKAGIAVPPASDIPTRLVFCAKLAHLLGVLHKQRREMVYGDLSLRNIVFSMRPVPRLMLVDCDAARHHTVAFDQGNTPGWFPPEVASKSQRSQDIETDRYKLALFILRCLSPGPKASTATDPARMIGILDLLGNDLMRAGLAADRSGRPSARDWYVYLLSYIADLTQPPEIASVGVDETIVVPGTRVTVSWRVSGASALTVTTSDGIDHAVAGGPIGQGTAQLAVSRSGPFTVTARNAYGATSALTEAVVVFEPPRIELVSIPEPPIPSMSTDTEYSVAEGVGNALMASGAPPTIALPPFPAAAIFSAGTSHNGAIERHLDISQLLDQTLARVPADLVDRATRDAVDVLDAARDQSTTATSGRSLRGKHESRSAVSHLRRLARFARWRAPGRFGGRPG